MDFFWMFMAITYEATSFWKAAQPAWISRWKRNVMKQMGFLALKKITSIQMPNLTSCGWVSKHGLMMCNHRFLIWNYSCVLFFGIFFVGWIFGVGGVAVVVETVQGLVVRPRLWLAPVVASGMFWVDAFKKNSNLDSIDLYRDTFEALWRSFFRFLKVHVLRLETIWNIWNLYFIFAQSRIHSCWLLL